MTTNKKIAAVAGIVGGMIAAATSASAALNLPTQSCSYNFTVNMKKGTRNAQVMDLQKVLNNYPQTTVALSGAGSKGMETTLYGAATAKAVAKFQELHAAETLTPIGATKGTGNAFALTRAVLNQICSGSVVVNPTNPTTPVVNGSVVASLTAGQPNQVIVATQAAAKLADFTFSGNGTVTSVKLMRTGISNNDTLTNVYLYEGATRLTDAASVSINGGVNFNSTAGLFTVNGSPRTITVRADVNASTSGQSVGMALVGYTTMGASSSVVMLAGNNQPIANVALAGLSLQSQTSATNTNLNIPQTNYNVWGTSVNVSTRAVSLKSLAVKMIGSAPVNAVANVQLYVDGVSVGSAVADMNQRFTFAPNKFLSTGSHTLEVRADVVSGSDRSFYFILENVADILAEDSQVTGANVSLAQAGYAAFRQGLPQKISSATNASITLATDPTFNASNLVSGATNQTIAKYKLTAFGEDTKIQFLSVTPTVSGGSGLTNVALYVNGAQIGSNYTVASGAAQQFTLGSNFIATAGVASTVEVRADLIGSNGVNATGTVSAALSLISGQGESSKNAFGPVSPLATVRTLTIGGGNLSIGNTIGAVNTTVSANSNVKIASFSIQGGSVEAVSLKTLVLGLGGTVPTNLISNITLTDEAGAVLGNPSGISSAAQTYSVSAPVAIGQTKTVNVMATIGAATNGTTIIPTMTVSFTGAASNQSSTTAPVNGTTITIGNIAVNTPTVSSKVAANYVLGGLSKQVIVYNYTSTNGSATLNDATFTVTGNGVQSLTINGKTANVVGTTAIFYGLDLPIPSGNNGVNSPVTVNFTPAYVGTGNGVVSGTTNSISLTGTKTTDQSGNVVNNTGLTLLAGNTQTLVSSIPTVTVLANSGTNSGNGADVKLGTITITADKAGDIVVGKLAYTAASAGTTAVTSVKVNGSAAQDKAGTVGTVTATDVTFAAGYRVTAGDTVKFDIYGTVSGVTTAASVTSVALGANANFLWSDDATTAGTANTGTLLSSANYNK